MTLLGLRDHFPEARGKGQTSFWSRLNSSLYRNQTTHYHEFIKLIIKRKETRPVKEESGVLGAGGGLGSTASSDASPKELD